MRIPAHIPEAELVLALVEEQGVLIHPGYFFDFPSPGFLCVSLLPEPPTFEEGISRLAERLGATRSQ